MSAPRKAAGVLPAAIAVFRRELLAEWRTRVAVNSLFLFAFAVLVLVAYAVGPTRLSPEDRPTVNAVLLWIVLFFSAMTGLSRTFVHEEDAGTAAALRLSAPPSGVLLGKLLANVALLGAVTVFIVPLFVVLMGFEIK
ncbi:MAG: heme exporter protein CcmB, partial [Thermoanaerobaculia bacterium]